MTIPRRIIHQSLACLPVILNQFMVGVGWGWIAPTLVKIDRPDSPLGPLTVDQISWLASINEVGRLLGPFISPALVDNVGRRYTLCLVASLYFLVWLATSFARNIYLVLVARLLFGLANGMNDVVSGIYTTENCSPNFRGIVASIIVLMHQIGLFFELVVSSYLSYAATATTNAAMGVCVITTLYFCTETPYFLIMKGRREEAKKNLIWLSGNENGVEVVDELRQIEESVSAEKLKSKSLRLLLLSSANLRGILVVAALHILHMMTGPGVYITYASLLFSPSESVTTNMFTIMFGIAQLLATAVSPFIIERAGRRALMIGTFAGVAVGNACSCALIYARGHGYEVAAFYPWLMFTFVGGCGALIAFGTPVIGAVKGELLPLSVRAIGSSIAVTIHSITSFCVIKVFLPINTLYGMEANFLMYSTFAVLGVVLLFYTLPETKGKTLYELQKMDKDKDKDKVEAGELLKKVPSDRVEKEYVLTQQSTYDEAT